MDLVKKILYVQPFVLNKGGVEDNRVHMETSKGLLIWASYLDNYLKSKVLDLESELLYLPFEVSISIESYTQKDAFFSQMDNLISKLSFNKRGPMMICISVTTSHHFLASKLVGAYFQNRFPREIVVVGGVHASVVPYDFIYKNSPFDYIIVGEGELSLYALIKGGAGKQNTPKIIENSPIPILDKLPPLELSLFDKYSILRQLSVNLSRGCPFACSFCIEKTFCKDAVRSWRAYKPKRAVEELNSVLEYGKKRGVEIVTLNDPIFGFNKKWLEKFTEHFQIAPIPILVDTRIEILNEKILTLLNKKGFFPMYGLESCSREMLRVMNKTKDPSTYLKKFEDLAHIHYKLGSPYIINLLFNHPGETRETIKESMGKILEMINNEVIGERASFNFAVYSHFPGTRIYENMKNYKLQYGTIFYYPEWWKREETTQYGMVCVKPSFTLSFEESLRMFIAYTTKLEKAKLVAFTKGEKTTPDGWERFSILVNERSRMKALETNIMTFLEVLPPREKKKKDKLEGEN